MKKHVSAFMSRNYIETKYNELKESDHNEESSGSSTSSSMMQVVKTLPFVFDNIYVRSLCGPAVYGLPVGEITEEHYLKAVDVLKEIDFLVSWEWETTTDVLTRGLGWGIMQSSIVRKTPFELYFIHGYDEAWLTQLNKYDTQLYLVAHELHNKSVSLLRQKSTTLSINSTDNHFYIPIDAYARRQQNCCGVACV